MPDSIFKFSEKPLKLFFEKIVKEQIKFWFGVIVGMVLVLILN